MSYENIPHIRICLIHWLKICPNLLSLHTRHLKGFGHFCPGCGRVAGGARTFAGSIPHVTFVWDLMRATVTLTQGSRWRKWDRQTQTGWGLVKMKDFWRIIQEDIKNVSFKHSCFQPFPYPEACFRLDPH